MPEPEMTPIDVWNAMVGEPHGLFLRQALMMLLMVPPEAFADGLARIERATAFGPLIDPTAWLNGERFDNARDYRDVLGAALELRKKLEDVRQREAQRHV